jgi:hypothetical protein
MCQIAPAPLPAPALNRVPLLLSSPATQLQQEKDDEGAESERDDAYFSDALLHDVVMSFMIAGRDTTAATLTFLFRMLARNRAVQDELVREIDLHYGTGKGARPVCFGSIRKLKYPAPHSPTPPTYTTSPLAPALIRRSPLGSGGPFGRPRSTTRIAPFERPATAPAPFPKGCLLKDPVPQRVPFERPRSPKGAF